MNDFDIVDAMLRERGNHLENPNSSPTLTDEEREAVEWAAKVAADPTPVAWYAPQIAATLRALLERTK